ncbi:hypothetical protein FOL47_007257 [Perkinsus chesapeaki]|uniref:Uncharacterized protein n=1 Tax=Perkinsus chesapeaki TaxID=330153 RepID=A0A7J6LLT6_PERCH|nr:hypothetical protein FOL47_007257 [Perkinsus chesapeaki]
MESDDLTVEGAAKVTEGSVGPMLDNIKKAKDVAAALALTEELVTSSDFKKAIEGPGALDKMIEELISAAGDEKSSLGALVCLGYMAEKNIGKDEMCAAGRIQDLIGKIRSSGSDEMEVHEVLKNLEAAVGEGTPSTENPGASETQAQTSDETDSDLGLWETIREAVLEVEDNGEVEETNHEGVSSMLARGLSNFTAKVKDMAHDALTDDEEDEEEDDDDKEEENAFSGMLMKGFRSFKATVDDIAHAVGEDDENDDAGGETVSDMLKRGYENAKATASEIAHDVDEEEKNDRSDEEPKNGTNWTFATTSLEYLKTSVAALAASIDSNDEEKEKEKETGNEREENTDSNGEKDDEEDVSPLAGALVGGWSLV